VVRSFNQQAAETRVAPRFGDLAAKSFMAGNDADPRWSSRAADVVGLGAIDAGLLSSARYLQPATLLWIAVAQALGNRHLG
jgi:predicted dinucleotide-binding enzyme